MLRSFTPALVVLMFLAACGAETAMRMGPDGRPVPVIYRIGQSDVPRIQARMRDAVNSVRRLSGLPPVTLNAELTSAAATHARDMSIQARPWHFGSDGSSPIDRVARAGYGGRFIGEAISETFETELETLTVWLEQRETRGLIMDPRANEIGFAWHQEMNGKLWWTLTIGEGAAPAPAPAAAVGPLVQVMPAP